MSKAIRLKFYTDCIIMLLKVNMKVILILERKPRTLRFREIGKSLLRSGARQHGAGSGAG